MRIAMFGTGYVGLVTGACLTQTGNTVMCCDVDANKINTLKQGHCPFHEPGLEELLTTNIKAKRLAFTSDPAEAIRENKIIMITVGTPPRDNGEPNLNSVYQVAGSVGESIKEEKIIVQKSTVPVGTADRIEEIIREKLKERGIDVDFEVASNPEFLKEGDAVNDFMSPDRIIVGTINKKAKTILGQLYAPFMKRGYKIIWTDRRSAELIKYAANSMLALRISFINSLAQLCEKEGANIEDIRRGMGSDPRIGEKFLYPGIGYGGSCFPKDVRAMDRMVKEALPGDTHTLFGVTEHINRSQKVFFLEKIVRRFNEDLGSKTFGIWGLSFKANTSDTRESAAYYVVKELLRAVAEVKVYDPQAMEEFRCCFGQKTGLFYVPDQYEAVKGVDALIILTEWLQFRNPDLAKMKSIMQEPLIFDGRNLYNPDYMKEEGFEYYDIGRAHLPH